MARGRLPEGIVTFLFTDIEGSTKLYHRLGDTFVERLAQHNELVRAAFGPHRGVEVKTEGDAFFVAFADPGDAVAACLDTQIALADFPWPVGQEIRVRMGLHRGPALVVADDYVGLAVHEAARIASAAHGGQVVLSSAIIDAVAGSLPRDATLRDLGHHALKDFPEPQQLWQLCHPRLTATFPELRTLTAATHNLPAPPTALIGRAHEIGRATECLLGDVRLVTLTGTGGIGKTRLAVEIAHRLLAYFTVGVWQIPLAAVSDPGDVLPAVAEALGVVEQPGSGLVEQIAAHLTGPTLLYFDNYEHVLDAATVVSDLLTACPQLKVLATSRERLRLRGEHDLVVPPLDQEPARVLFAERCRAVEADFHVDATNETAVAEVVARLAGVPLALELTAAHIRDIPLDRLAAALDRSLDLLTEGDRDLPVRQQTLRATIAWSYDLLTAAEQVVFRQLAPFAGTSSIEAAEAIVTGIDDVEVAGADVAGAVRSLGAKSLVRTDGDRFSVLEPIRQYAAELLDASGAGHDVRLRHARWFTELAETSDARLTSADQLHGLEVLDREHDNLRRALASDDHALALQVAGALARYWSIRGYWTEGRQWLSRLLASATGDPLVVARALFGAAGLALHQGDLDEASRLHEEALALRRAHGDVGGTAMSLVQLAELRRARGDSAGARALLDEAIDRFVSIGDRRGVGLAQIAFGMLAAYGGDLPGAREQFELALTELTAAGDERMIARVGGNLATIAAELGDPTAAEAALRTSLVSLRAVGERGAEASTLYRLAKYAVPRGDIEEAAQLVVAGLDIARELGDKNLAAQLVAVLANVEADGQRKRALLHDALTMAIQIGDGRMEAARLGDLAMLDAAEGDATAARTRLAEVDRLRANGLDLGPDETFDHEERRVLVAESLNERREAGRILAGLVLEVATGPGRVRVGRYLVKLASLVDDDQLAAQLIGAAANVGDENANLEATLQSRLGPGAFAAARAEGATVDLAELLGRMNSR